MADEIHGLHGLDLITKSTRTTPLLLALWGRGGRAYCQRVMITRHKNKTACNESQAEAHDDKMGENNATSAPC